MDSGWTRLVVFGAPRQLCTGAGTGFRRGYGGAVDDGLSLRIADWDGICERHWESVTANGGDGGKNASFDS